MMKRVWVLWVLLLVDLPSPCAAGNIQQHLLPLVIDPSPHSLALGGAGVALPGDDALSSFLNPAHLAAAEGIEWAHGRLQFAPELADSIVLRSNFVMVGAGGIGFAFDGRPFSSLGGTRLDFPSRVAGLGGGDRATWQDVREFGVGVDVVRTFRQLGPLVHVRLPRLDDHVELSLGSRWKRFTAMDGIFTSKVDSGSATDRGVLLRLTPYHRILGEFRNGEIVEDAKFRGIGGLAIDLYGGLAYLNRSVSIDTTSEMQFVPLLGSHQTRRAGIGVVLRTGAPAFLQQTEAGETPALARWLGPLLRLSATYETVDDNNIFDTMAETIHSRGAEATLLGVLTGRLGHIHQPPVVQPGTELDDGTSGYGLTLHYADALSFRYDRASTRQLSPIDHRRLHPWSWRVNFNPYGVLKILLGG